MSEASDLESITAVIARESDAFWDKDFGAWAACWVQRDYVRRLGWWAAGGVTVVEGWQQLSARIRETMEAHPVPNPTARTARRERFNVQVRTDTAWVTFDQYGTDTGDARMDMPGLSRETRILEKEGGEWKIAYVGYILEGTDEHAGS